MKKTTKIKFPRPKFTWDTEYGLGYVYLNKGKHYETKQLFHGDGSYVLMDLDKKGNLLGLEIIL